jgi:hypothetical protein
MKQKYSADNGIIPGEIVRCLSDFHRTMDVEIIDILEKAVEGKVETFYLFRDTVDKESNGLVGIGKLSQVNTDLKYHVEACLIRSFGEGQSYASRDEAIASLRH